MRPREIPAEAPRSARGCSPRPCFNEAAGDPRGSREDPGRRRPGDQASMRPREIPAEARSSEPHCSCGSASFNEAAGDPRGSRPRECQPHRAAPGFNEAAGDPRGSPDEAKAEAEVKKASMRPREIPAEASRRCCAVLSRRFRFNEAAGDPRGSPSTPPRTCRQAASLQ